MSKKKRIKRITVQILCQNVDSEGNPVNSDGEAFGRGWQKMLTMEPKRIRKDRFCPGDLADGKREVMYRGSDQSVVKCKCHGKWRLQ